jgi:hypothetical protein
VAVSKPPSDQRAIFEVALSDAACTPVALMAVVAAAVAGGRGLLESAAGDSGGYTKPVCACFVRARRVI